MFLLIIGILNYLFINLKFEQSVIRLICIHGDILARFLCCTLYLSCRRLLHLDLLSETMLEKCTLHDNKKPNLYYMYAVFFLTSIYFQYYVVFCSYGNLNMILSYVLTSLLPPSQTSNTHMQLIILNS